MDHIMCKSNWAGGDVGKQAGRQAGRRTMQRVKNIAPLVMVVRHEADVGEALGPRVGLDKGVVASLHRGWMVL